MTRLAGPLGNEKFTQDFVGLSAWLAVKRPSKTTNPVASAGANSVLYFAETCAQLP